MRRTVIRRWLLLAALLLAACAAPDLPYNFGDLPAGDAARGALLFQDGHGEAPACATCHHLDETAWVGPGLGGFGQRAASTAADESAAEYSFNSIVRPGKFTVSGYSNQMFKDYARQLTPQQVADLIAYLLTL